MLRRLTQDRHKICVSKVSLEHKNCRRIATIVLIALTTAALLLTTGYTQTVIALSVLTCATLVQVILVLRGDRAQRIPLLCSMGFWLLIAACKIFIWILDIKYPELRPPPTP